MQNYNYKNKFGISQSAIKDFLNQHPKVWKSNWIDNNKSEEKEQEHFTFGSFVDTLCFTPNLINERFYISNLKKYPSENVTNIINSLVEAIKKDKEFYNLVLNTKHDVDPSSDLYDKRVYTLLHPDIKPFILKAYEGSSFGEKWSNEVKINKITVGQEYFDQLLECDNKLIITTDINLEAISLVNSVKTNKNTQKYFINNDIYNNIYQLEIFCDYEIDNTEEFIPVKCAIDILHINREKRQIQIVDFKTTMSVFDFKKSIYKYKYDYQLSFYYDIFKYKFQNDIEFQKSLEIDETYILVEPINIAIDKNLKIPYIFQYDIDTLVLAKKGNFEFLNYLYNTTEHKQPVKVGWLETLKTIKKHIKLNMWDYSIEHFENGFIKV